MLRGPQTVGELRIRTERAATFIDLDEVEATLSALATREPPLVRRLERRPGQKEPRWMHLLGGDHGEGGEGEAVSGAVAPGAAPSAGMVDRVGSARSADGSRVPAGAPTGEIAALRAEVQALRSLVTHLYALLDEPLPGAAPGDGDPVVSGAIIVIGGGEAPDVAVVALVPAPICVIAADSGVDHARTLGLAPDVVVGDLDSVSADGLAWADALGADIQRHPADKDATDLELALDVAELAAVARHRPCGLGRRRRRRSARPSGGQPRAPRRGPAWS